MEVNKKRSITSFISSANRQPQENVYNFTIDYPDGILSCNTHEYMELNVLSFDMPNTMYNISAKNNTFAVITDDIEQTKTIPEGNYSVKTFMGQLNTLISSSLVTIVYNEAQNTYTFSKQESEPSVVIKLKPITIGNLLGITDDTEYEISVEGWTTGLVNLINYNKVMVSTDNISFYYNNVQNLATQAGNQQLFSNIVFWKSKADIEPFQILRYNNEDGGNSFVYRIENRQINSMSLQLKNENGEFITDAPDYLMVIQYNIYERKPRDIHAILGSIDDTIREFYNTILFALNKMRLLL